jgi:succinate-semialdehyde dehydrogenase / glutarate-semialdehyde dehydrogenase
MASRLASITYAASAASGSARQILPSYLLNAHTSSTTSSIAAAAGPPSLLSLINGQWVGAESGKTIPVRSPADGTILAHVPNMAKSDTLSAINAASMAFPKWSALSPFERSAAVMRMYNLLVRSADEVGVLLSLESGKPHPEAVAEVKYAADFFEWYAEEGKRSYGQVLPPQRADRRLLTMQQPIGVAACLTPWNFPAAMPARKLAPALVAGCTVVLRPSIDTPLSALALARMSQEAGIPAGVVNVVLGDDHVETAGVLCSSSLVKKLSFTGSTQVGKQLAAACAPTLKRLSLELGGRAPFIVFDDADVDAATEGAVQSKFRNAGQTCVCANTFLIQSGIADVFVSKLVSRITALKVGDGMVSGTQVGPLISEKALVNMEALVSDAVSKGAVVVSGGTRVAVGVNGGKGYFFAPTVLDHCRPGMKCVDEEVFGPIAPIIRFKDDSDAINIANSSSVGLAAYFFTSNNKRTWRVQEALQVGMVGVNTGLISTAAAPFGGIKDSGYGREGAQQGLSEYLQWKYVMQAI